jgi:hypothetical protein
MLAIILHQPPDVIRQMTLEDGNAVVLAYNKMHEKQ